MPTQSANWLDGELTSAVPLPNRGLDFGDGVFETLLLQRGNLLFLNTHMERLERGIDVLALPACLDAVEQYVAIATRYIAQQQWPWTALRVTVTRGFCERGYAPSDKAPRVIIMATRLERDCATMTAAATLSVANIRLATQPLLAGIKHLNRLEQVLAAAQTQKDKADESIMLDQSECLTSVVAGNLFLLCGGDVVTPELKHCGVSGTRRRLIMEQWCPSLGLKVREAKLTMRDLWSAQEVFYSNSLQTVRPVARIGRRTWENFSVCEALFSKYLEHLTSCA